MVSPSFAPTITTCLAEAHSQRSQEQWAEPLKSGTKINPFSFKLSNVGYLRHCGEKQRKTERQARVLLKNTLWMVTTHRWTPLAATEMIAVGEVVQNHRESCPLSLRFHYECINTRRITSMASKNSCRRWLSNWHLSGRSFAQQAQNPVSPAQDIPHPPLLPSHPTHTSFPLSKTPSIHTAAMQRSTSWQTQAPKWSSRWQAGIVLSQCFTWALLSVWLEQNSEVSVY